MHMIKNKCAEYRKVITKLRKGLRRPFCKEEGNGLYWLGFLVKWYTNLHKLFNAKAILVKGQ